MAEFSFPFEWEKWIIHSCVGPTANVQREEIIREKGRREGWLFFYWSRLYYSALRPLLLLQADSILLLQSFCWVHAQLYFARSSWVSVLVSEGPVFYGINVIVCVCGLFQKESTARNTYRMRFQISKQKKKIRSLSLGHFRGTYYIRWGRDVPFPVSCLFISFYPSENWRCCICERWDKDLHRMRNNT